MARAASPVRDARSDHAHAPEVGPGHRAAPNTRLQLLPPKPKEFDSTCRSGRSSAQSRIRLLKRRIELARVEAARNEAVLQAQRRDDRFGDAGGAQRVPGPALGRAARRRIAEDAVDRRVLGAIVGGRRRAVQVDVVDLVRREARARERVAHRLVHAGSFGVRRGHVVAVGAFAVAQQRHCAGRSLRALEQHEARRLADRDAVALRVARPARLARQQLERAEPVQRREAEAVDAADHRGVGESRLDQPMGARENLGARRARRGDGRRRAAADRR